MDGDALGIDLDLIREPYRELLGLVSKEAGKAGMSLYLAGGIVRDLLLGRPIRDLDLVVEGDAIRLARALAKSHGGKVTAHPKFGTATWILPAGGEITGAAVGILDLATARKESYPSPGALPVVEFAGIQDDLRRRDFTINAMAVGLENGRVGERIDPFGGTGDLEQRLIRVLHPRSFVDDPTRMFRALRYAERYGFEIAPETRGLFDEEAQRVLGSLSGERLRHELDLVLEEAHPSRILGQAQKLGLLAALDPRLPALDARLERMFDPTPSADSENGEAGRTRRYVLWLVELPPEILSEIGRRLAFDGTLDRALRAAAQLLRDLPGMRGRSPSEWTARLDKVPPDAVWAVYLKTGEPALDAYTRTWRHVRARANGEALKRRGLEPGPAFKTILWRLRAAWLDGEVDSEEEEAALLDRLLKER